MPTLRSLLQLCLRYRAVLAAVAALYSFMPSARANVPTRRTTETLAIERLAAIRNQVRLLPSEPGEEQLSRRSRLAQYYNNWSNWRNYWRNY